MGDTVSLEPQALRFQTDSLVGLLLGRDAGVGDHSQAFFHPSIIHAGACVYKS
jgi:hypothetical protein